MEEEERRPLPTRSGGCATAIVWFMAAGAPNTGAVWVKEAVAVGVGGCSRLFLGRPGGLFVVAATGVAAAAATGATGASDFCDELAGVDDFLENKMAVRRLTPDGV